MSTAVEFCHVTKRYSDSAGAAVKDISFSVEEGEFITILGTSGCGKTTLMRMVNGLVKPTEGTIRVMGSDLKEADVVELRRNIGYVIQQIGLFPHMTVGKNIGTVPEILKWDKARIQKRVDELLLLVNLNPQEYRDRYPSQLSGGQQQRVGLARALAADPAILLMDEPFGAIDAINRTRLQDELLAIYRQQHKTILFVTHDVTEALKLGSRVMIMDRGEIMQFDSPLNILEHPANAYVESLIEAVRLGLSFAGRVHGGRMDDGNA